MSVRGLPDPARLALGTLTVVPVPPPTTVDRRVAGRAMLLAPLAAVVPALGAAAVLLAGGALELAPLVTGVLAVAALALLTRGLHLDGLADTADGLAAAYDRAQALDVMRRGDVGPAGALTLVVVVVAQAASLARLTGWRGALVAGVAVVASRAVLAACCSTPVPSARPTGLGATVAGSVPVAAAAAVGAAAAALVVVADIATGGPAWRPLVAAAVAVAAAGWLLLRCVRRLGGITGDVLGGCVELALTGLLVVLAAAG